jgi:hypothetical protein
MDLVPVKRDIRRESGDGKVADAPEPACLVTVQESLEPGKGSAFPNGYLRVYYPGSSPGGRTLFF